MTDLDMYLVFTFLVLVSVGFTGFCVMGLIDDRIGELEDFIKERLDAKKAKRM